MEMKKVYYEESYNGIFEVPEEIANGSEEEIGAYLADNRLTEEVEGSGSIIAPLIGNGDPQYQIMGAKIEALDEYEKKFYLWHLLRFYYADKLRKEKEEYKDSRDLIDRLLANVNEIDTLLCYDLF